MENTARRTPKWLMVSLAALAAILMLEIDIGHGSCEASSVSSSVQSISVVR